LVHEAGKFTSEEKQTLVDAFGKRNCYPLEIFCKPAAVQDVIARLEMVAMRASHGEFDRDPQWVEFLKQFGQQAESAGYANLARGILDQIKPRRGRPEDMKQVRIAEAVGWVLLTSGARSHRSKELLPRSRSGFYARSVAVVLRASGEPVPADILALITRVAPYVEWMAMHDG
jgi:hypothetical protein